MVLPIPESADGAEPRFPCFTTRCAALRPPAQPANQGRAESDLCGSTATMLPRPGRGRARRISPSWEWPGQKYESTPSVVSAPGGARGSRGYPAQVGAATKALPRPGHPWPSPVRPHPAPPPRKEQEAETSRRGSPAHTDTPAAGLGPSRINFRVSPDDRREWPGAAGLADSKLARALRGLAALTSQSVLGIRVRQPISTAERVQDGQDFPLGPASVGTRTARVAPRRRRGGNDPIRLGQGGAGRWRE